MHINEALKIRLFRIVIGYASIYHILLGLLGTFAGPSIVVGLSSTIFGISPTPDDQFLVTGRFAAAYMLAFGMMLGLLAIDPRKYSMLVWPGVVLFALRIFDRLVYAGQLERAFGTTLGRSLITVAMAVIIIAALVVLRPTGEPSVRESQ